MFGTEVRTVLSQPVNHVFNDCKRVVYKYILLLNAVSLVQDVTHSSTWEEAYALALTLFFYPDIMLVS